MTTSYRSLPLTSLVCNKSGLTLMPHFHNHQ